MKINKPFAKFEDFGRRMSNKLFFEEATPGLVHLLGIKNFTLKTIFGWMNSTMKLIISVITWNHKFNNRQMKVLKQNLCKQRI